MNTKDIPREKLVPNDTLETKQVEDLKNEISKLRLELNILKETINVIKKDSGVDMSILKNSEKTAVINALKNSYPLQSL